MTGPIGGEVLLDSHEWLSDGMVLLDVRPCHLGDGGIWSRLIHTLEGAIVVQEPDSILRLLT